uniref:Uncharacterized protein n=1 Tax=Hippocampus comes TaxID=109280 RepID=A0A3Q2Z721_HIPCM
MFFFFFFSLWSHFKNIPEVLYEPPVLASAKLVFDLFSLVDRDPSSINARDDVTGDTPIIAACRGAKLDAVTFLLERHADVRALNKVSRGFTSRLLHLLLIFAFQKQTSLDLSDIGSATDTNPVTFCGTWNLNADCISEISPLSDARVQYGMLLVVIYCPPSLGKKQSRVSQVERVKVGADAGGKKKKRCHDA